MRGFAALLAYVVGLSAMIGVGAMVMHYSRHHPKRPLWRQRIKSVPPSRLSKRQLLKQMRNPVRSARWRL